MPKLIIAIPTFRRVDRLARLLDALPAQQLEASSVHGVETSVLVIDNDPAGSARRAAEDAGTAYVPEPRPGLAAVRNAALDASRGADALVFIDDDEIPETGWLAALVGAWIVDGSQFVSGRVVSTFDSPLDPWIDAGGFFRRVTFATGEPMRFAPTNNLLIDLGFVMSQGLRFDEAFALSGGEDIRFTRQAVALGARITACPDALVLDPVPRERATRSWVLRRAFRVGTTTVRGELAGRASLARRWGGRIGWFVMGVGRVGAGAARWALGAVSRSLVHQARGARLVARGAGMVWGALGMDYREYRTRHSQ